MKILHLEASSGWGGQEIRILKEAEGMRSRGHFVVFGVMKRGHLVQRAKDAGFQVYELNFKKLFWPICLIQLLRILFFHRIDLINTHSSLDGWIGGIAARLSRKKIVRTRHLSTPIKQGLNSRLVYGKLADFVVTTCESIIPIIARQSGKPLEKIRSIATGVDPKKIFWEETQVKAFRKAIGASEKDLVVGTVCVMRSWKGIGDFLQAAHLLRKEPHLKWVIIGGGHALIHQKMAKELQLESIVHFAGHLEPPFSAMQALDVFALLSTANEGVSQAILQAAYLKKPLIATPTGGLKEVCIDQETGISVPILSPESVAQAVLKMKANPNLRKSWGENAYCLVLKKFTFQNTLDQMEEVFHSLRDR